MSAIIKTAASLACLATVALAGPINARHESDCAAGTVFYSCANGYRGCFTKDPCALPPIATTSIPLPPATTTTPPSVTSVPAGCPAGTTNTIWQPTMYNLYPSEPEKAQDAVSHLHISYHKDAPALEQVAIFHLPANAKTCSLNWAQADEAERTFVVDESGLASILPLTGFPAAGTPVSAASVAPYEPATGSTHADFTFWDKQAKDATTHSVGNFVCAENVYFKLSIDSVNGDGEVFMEQDKKNGFFVTYTC
ncbi:hypothetical protein F5Y04DRAFT_241648 [Hypomontagnella monticulosa]|nr:hypothetical protein F5Y04DRAFT_241648 [Hypomontagnella monticulosa]